jgi:hypothetical protein
LKVKLGETELECSEYLMRFYSTLFDNLEAISEEERRIELDPNVANPWALEIIIRWMESSLLRDNDIEFFETVDLEFPICHKKLLDLFTTQDYLGVDSNFRKELF